MTKKCQNCGHGKLDHYVGKGSLPCVAIGEQRLGRCRKEFVRCKHCNNTGIVRKLEHFDRGLTSLTATIRRVCEHCKTYHHRLTGGNWLDYWAEDGELVNLKKCKCKKFVPFDTIADLKRRVEILT